MIVAIGATTPSFAAIPVGAGKAGVEGDFLHLPLQPFGQKGGEGAVKGRGLHVRGVCLQKYGFCKGCPPISGVFRTFATATVAALTILLS